MLQEAAETTGSHTAFSGTVDHRHQSGLWWENRPQTFTASSHGMDHGPQQGLWRQHTPHTPSQSSVAAQAMDIGVASGGNMTHSKAPHMAGEQYTEDCKTRENGTESNVC